MAESRVFALNGVSVQMCELVSFIFDKNLSWEKSGGRFLHDMSFQRFCQDKLIKLQKC